MYIRPQVAPYRKGKVLMHASKWLFLCLLSMALLSGCAGVRNTPVSSSASALTGYPPGQLLRLQGERLQPVSDGELLEAAKDADYILVGEGHTVACDHVVQARILSLLAEGGLSPVVGLEMVGEDRQPALDSFNQGGAGREGEAGLRALYHGLKWEKKWGYPFDLYRPIFQAAQEHKTPLFALNIPPHVIKETRKYEKLEMMPAGLRKYLPKKLFLPNSSQQEFLEMQFNWHSKMRKDKAKAAKEKAEKQGKKAPKSPRKARMFKHFLQVQGIWDSKMAERAVQVHKESGRPVLILAGAGHVEYDWGVAYRIKLLEPEANVVSLMPWRGGDLPVRRQADIFFACAETHSSRLGLTLAWNAGAKHAQVLDVALGSRAEKAGFKPGDAIIAAMGAPMQALSDLHIAALKARRKDKPLKMRIQRDGEEIDIDVMLSK